MGKRSIGRKRVMERVEGQEKTRNWIEIEEEEEEEIEGQHNEIKTRKS